MNINKRQLGAFYETYPELKLRRLGIDTMMFEGLRPSGKNTTRIAYEYRAYTEFFEDFRSLRSDKQHTTTLTSL